MKHLEQESRKGPQGSAQVNTIGQTLTVQFLDDWGHPAGRMFPLPADSYPYKIVDGVYSVSLSADGDKLYGIRPLNATVVARFDHFATKENQLPAPKHVTGTRQKKDGTSYPIDELTFTAILRIVSPAHYQGMELVLPLLYSRKGSGFCDDGNGNLAYRGGGDKGDRWIAFCDAAGIGGHLFPFSDNPLPMLEAKLKEVDKEFMVILGNGWCNAFGEVMTSPSPKVIPTMTDGEAQEWLHPKEVVAERVKPATATKPTTGIKPSQKPNGNGKSASASSKTKAKVR